MVSVRHCPLFAALDELLEVGALAILNHLEVLVVELARLEILNRIPLPVVLLFKRLLLLLEEPLQNLWIVVT